MGAAASTKNNQENMTKLFKAIEENDYILATRLIFQGFYVNCTNFRGETPLIATCRDTTEKEMEMGAFVQFLVANGAHVKRVDTKGWTASIHARENGYEQVAKLLEKLERKESQLNRKELVKFGFLQRPKNGNYC